MKTKSVSKADFVEAVFIKQNLLPAIAALKKIDARALAGNSYTAKTISRAVSAMEAHIKDAERLIFQSDADFQVAGGMVLLNKISTRMFSIDGEITFHKRHSELAIEAHTFKVNSLKNDGFDKVQIDQIEPFPGQEVDGHAAAIEALRSEKANLESFIASSPAFELEYLIGTPFEGGLSQGEAA